MKVVHDLKNPVMSLKQTFLDEEVSLTVVRRLALGDVEELEEMLENLRAQFKYTNNMDFKEEAKEVAVHDFALSFSRIHANLAEVGGNTLSIQVCKGFPSTISIQRNLIKRIVNNFVSNSLKHTYMGRVELCIRLSNIKDVVYEK